MTKKFRIPGRLKKKLQASLESLTPREAGRLALIYMHEAQRKGLAIQEYPPAVQLGDAWKRRVQKAKAGRHKDPDAEKRTVNAHNAWVFLHFIARTVNVTGSAHVNEVLAYTNDVIGDLRVLLIGDMYSQVLGAIEGSLWENVPWPVSHEDYDRIVTWCDKESLIFLDEIAEDIVEEWAEDNFTELQVPHDFKGRQDDPTNPVKRYLDDEDLRRKWVEAEGKDRVLEEHFEGNRAMLEEWLRRGYYVDLSDEAKDTKWDEVFKPLEAALQSGKLKGGEAVETYVFGTILLSDGKLPVWAALRHVWESWLFDNQCRESPFSVPTPGTIRGLKRVTRWKDGSPVEGEALTALAAGLVEDCRSRPWGDGIAEAVDYAAVADMLIQDSHPLLEQIAPDLGFVDFETFAEHEQHPRRLVAGLAATVESLRKAKLDREFSTDFYKDQYYPTRNPDKAIKDLAFTFRLIKGAKVTKRRLSTLHLEGNNKTVEFFGEDFASPLEQTLQQLAERKRDLEEIRQVFEIISERYFGGMYLLAKNAQEQMSNLERKLADAENFFNQWATRFEGVFFNLEEDLSIPKLPPRQSEIDEFVDALLHLARIEGRFSEEEVESYDFDAAPETLKQGRLL